LAALGPRAARCVIFGFGWCSTAEKKTAPCEGTRQGRQPFGVLLPTLGDENLPEARIRLEFKSFVPADRRNSPRPRAATPMGSLKNSPRQMTSNRSLPRGVGIAFTVVTSLNSLVVLTLRVCGDRLSLRSGEGTTYPANGASAPFSAVLTL
jgi:hypothetical protein